jgi:hypothetical protein
MGRFTYAVMEEQALVKGFLDAPVRPLVWRGDDGWSVLGMPLGELAGCCRVRIITDDEATAFMDRRRWPRQTLKPCSI